MLNEAIIIRQAISSDTAGIGKVLQSTPREVEDPTIAAMTATEPNWWDQPTAIEMYTRRIEDAGDDVLRLVAIDGKHIVGFASANKLEHTNSLHTLYVLPSYQRQKVGYRLMLVALEWLGRDKDVTLQVLKGNAKAIQFYRQVGFEITSEISTEILPQYQMTRHFIGPVRE